MSKKTEYIPVTETIRKASESFKNWLMKLYSSKDTLNVKVNYASYFLNYLEKENINIKQIAYTDLLDFVNYCKEANLSITHINNIIRALRNYFNYLCSIGKLDGNPADGLKLRGKIQIVVSDTLSREELEKIYHEYEVNSDHTLKNKIILGLLIYQALTLDDLNNLLTEHVKLRKGKIYIPSGKQRKSRILRLESHQIIDLQEYILQAREKLLSKYPGETDKLFLTSRSKFDMRNTLRVLFKQLNKINPLIKNATQIRMSVITNWIKHYNLREAQYMAGHKVINSTERYQTANLEELSKALEKFHPLN